MHAVTTATSLARILRLLETRQRPILAIFDRASTRYSSLDEISYFTRHQLLAVRHEAAEELFEKLVLLLSLFADAGVQVRLSIHLLLANAHLARDWLLALAVGNVGFFGVVLVVLFTED